MWHRLRVPENSAIKNSRTYEREITENGENTILMSLIISTVQTILIYL
jgi:hypothetical protein